MSFNYKNYNHSTELHKTRKKSRGVNTKELIVPHYTAGSSFDSAVKTLSVANAKVSCQFVIGREVNEIAQIGSMDDIQWHVGKSKYKVNGITRTNLNARSIGIEIVNPGFLKHVGGSTYETYWGKRYDENKDNLIISKHKYMGRERFGWLPYTEWQLEETYKLCEALIEYYPSIVEVVGHEDIAWPRGRKQDPATGIIFPKQMLDRLNSKIKGHGRIDEKDNSELVSKRYSGDGVVEVSNFLNIRAWPSPKSRVVGKLKDGDKVKFNRMVNDWYELDTNKWVHSAYIKEV